MDKRTQEADTRVSIKQPRYTIVFENGQLRIVDMRGCELDQSTTARIIKSLLATDGVAEERRTPACVYILEKQVDEDDSDYKIGMTGQPIDLRVAAIRRSENDPNIRLVHSIQCSNIEEAYELEQTLHNYFDDYLIYREWFVLDEQELNWLSQIRTPQDISQISLHPPTLSNDVLLSGEIPLLSRSEKHKINRMMRFLSRVGRSEISQMNEARKSELLDDVTFLQHIANKIEEAIYSL